MKKEFQLATLGVIGITVSGLIRFFLMHTIVAPEVLKFLCIAAYTIPYFDQSMGLLPKFADMSAHRILLSGTPWYGKL